jgi:antirestriction protein ArdC
MTHLTTNERKEMGKTDIYQNVTNTIIAAIEAGQTGDKLHMPWSGFPGLPTNAHSGKAYRGVNIPTLWALQLGRGYTSENWATYKQWQALGAQVRKGEKAAPIVFWKAVNGDPDADHAEADIRMVARWSMVFNADQVDGYTPPAPAPGAGQAAMIEHVEQFLLDSGADIRHGGGEAYYHFGEDYIALPAMALFHDTPGSTATEAYYATALHELTHWTGSARRLDRTQPTRFGGKAYAFEELVAELGAAMLCAMLGVTSSTRDDHAQYIDNWLKALKSDKRYIFSAASQAQKAADYLCSLQRE